MTEVSFYHLQGKPLEAALPELLAKVLESGQRAVLLTDLPERLEMLDSLLWTHDQNSFLPHGGPGADHAADQPVYLTTDEENPNGATILVLVDGADPSYLGGFERCLDIFDGRDEAAVAAARKRWGARKEAGHQITYWRQSAAGKWRKGSAG